MHVVGPIEAQYDDLEDDLISMEAKRDQFARSSPHIDRAILQENERAIRWRWELAQNSLINWKCMEGYFPGQQQLFKILGVIKLKRALSFAQVGSPLFKILLPAQIHLIPNEPQTHPLGPEIANEIEYFLHNRLDCLRINEYEAMAAFDLKKQSIMIRDKTISEIKTISFSPGVSVRLAASMEYFYRTAFFSENLSFGERTNIAINNRFRADFA